jgi:multidrug efflux pump subunit AcrA (membrane-fusion protein)
MDSTLMELLASRGGGNGNPAFSEILSRLKGADGADAQQNLNDLLSQAGSGNPIARYLAAQLAQSQANQAKPQPPVLEAELLETNAQASEEMDRASDSAMRQLRRQVESMYAELRLLRERNESLASALGACCLCWGKDPECRFCHGRGAPGFSIPDESLFGELVFPAIRIMQVHRARSKGFSSKPQLNNREESMPDEGR